MTTPEGKIAAKIKRLAPEYGLLVIRQHFAPGAKVGYPDLAILGPNGATLWVETKAPGQRLRPIQDERRKEIVALGHLYRKMDAVAEVEKVLLDFAAYCKLEGKLKDA